MLHKQIDYSSEFSIALQANYYISKNESQLLKLHSQY